MDGILFALLNTNALLAKLSQLNTLLFNVLSHIFGGNEATRQGIGSDGKKTAVYVDDQQRILIRQLARSWLWRSELPTWLLIVTVYGGWFACVAGWRTLGLFPATLLLIWFTAWYMSLQHELIHGHPTRLAWFNQLLGTLPLAVWYPYGVYRDSHLAHHRNHLLTHPEDDPESYYVTAESWQRFSAWQRRLIHLRNTFWGVCCWRR